MKHKIVLTEDRILETYFDGTFEGYEQFYEGDVFEYDDKYFKETQNRYNIYYTIWYVSGRIKKPKHEMEMTIYKIFPEHFLFFRLYETPEDDRRIKLDKIYNI